MSSIIVMRTNGSEYSQPENILFLGFHEESNLLACGTEHGFRILSVNSQECKEEYRKNFMDGGISYVEFMENNTVALVSGGYKPAFSMNKVVIYNYKEKKVLNEILCPRNVISVHFKHKFLVIVSEDMVFIYNYKFKEIFNFKTCLNPQGICSLVYNDKLKECILVFPTELIGHVKVIRLSTKKSKQNNNVILDEYELRAHDSSIQCISLNSNGSLLATASEKGTIVRLFQIINGEKLNEYRRGNLTNEIYSICFSHNNEYIACVSSGGTLHVFVLDMEKWKKNQQLNSSSNQTSNGILSYILNYTNETYDSTPKSVFKYRKVEGIGVCNFDVADEYIFVCTHKGAFHSLRFDLSGVTQQEEPLEAKEKQFYY
ncbi:hypothetical protein ABK040_008826 [Willaertia magna]